MGGVGMGGHDMLVVGVGAHWLDVLNCLRLMMRHLMHLDLLNLRLQANCLLLHLWRPNRHHLRRAILYHCRLHLHWLHLNRPARLTWLSSY